jgi:GMP synthase (glutamine-hydrolysing)
MKSAAPILVVVHQKTSTPGLVGHVLKHMGFSLDIRCPAIGDPLPVTMDHHSAAIVFGGPMSANDDNTFTFIRDELNWIPTVMAAEKPYLGICLGAQLLARALGAQVKPHPAGVREIGYFPIQPTVSGRPVIPSPLMVYQWHQEGFEIPHGGKLLATGSTFPHQALGYGHRAYGLQFHPEMTTLMVNFWTTHGADQLAYPGAQSRWYHLSQHRLYREPVERWLRQFLGHWIAPVLSAEVVWEKCHHSGTEPTALQLMTLTEPSRVDQNQLQQ